jgi:hypothetical protein
MGIHRQDAKFAKVDLLTRNFCFPWRPWRLGGEFLEVTCLATPDRRVLVLKNEFEQALRLIEPTARREETEAQDLEL